MKRPFISRFNQWIIFILLTAIAGATVVGFQVLIDYLRKEEIKRINLISKAIRIQQEITEPDPAILELIPEIMEAGNSIPLITLDREGRPLEHRNLPSSVVGSEEKLRQYALNMARTYEPIEIKLPDGNNQFVYYDNSALLKYLRYSPFILGAFVLIYLLFTFWFLRTIKKTDEGFVWAGLAKETAHQIGTPLSSMIGWIEIMKMESPDMMGVQEIEKDVERLRTISERFSKIGSVPELTDDNFTETIRQNYNYLNSRISTKVVFTLDIPDSDIIISHNRILMSWVIENLVKNAVDAMKGKGSLQMSLYEKGKNIMLDFRDNGCGMTSRQAANVFKPGYSTKKRGWGLGLSLARRVIKDYHKGDLRIAHTEPGKGTTFRIILRKEPRKFLGI